MSSPNDEGIRRSAAAGGAASGAGPSSAVASSSGSATATGSSGTASNTVASPTSFEEGGRARRGLDRLSGGLRELGLDVLSRRQRHERDKSNASSKSGGTVPATSAGATAGPKSPDLHKTSPPYSRSTTAEGDPKSPESATTPSNLNQPPLSATTTATSVSSPATPSEAFSTSSSSGIARRGAQRTHAGSTSQPPLKKPTFVLVTQDHEQLSRVDLKGLPSSAAIRERLYTKAHIPDDDFRHCTVHLSSLEQTDPGTPLDDSELWQICQGVLSGEITPPPLFYVQLSVAGPSSDLPYSHSEPHSGSPSPYVAETPGSAHSETHPERVEVRPDSYFDTSSNSSLNKPRAPSRRSPAEPRPPSPGRRGVAQTSSPSEGNRRSGDRRPSYHSPPLDQRSPQPPYFDSERRASAGSLNVPADPRDQQYIWDRRSSAGESDASGRPEFMERPNNLRRAERQARSEAQVGSSRDVWQYPSTQQPPSYATMGRGHSHQGSSSMQTMGIGPSGPLYRPVNQGHRSRSNSANAQDVLQSGSSARPGPSRNPAPMGFGPSGPLHFPQPIHHGQYSQQSSRPQPPTIVEHPHPAQYGSASHNGSRSLNIAKSMDNLRSPHSASYRDYDARNGHGALAPIPQYPGYDGQGRLYDDPRHPSAVPMHPSRSGLPDNRPYSAQAMQTPSTAASAAHMRSPPLNTAPRIPSYPPYAGPQSQPLYGHPQTNPSRQTPRHAQQSPPSSYPAQFTPNPHSSRPYPPAHGTSQPILSQRRPSSDLLQRAAPTALQVAPGPGRLPLHPGETLQDALHGGHRHDLPTSRPSRTSPQAALSSSPRAHAEPTFDYRYPQPQPQPQSRSASWEERPTSYFSAEEARHGQRYRQDERFAEDAPFTSSPPAQYNEQQPNLYAHDNSSNNARGNTASPPIRTQPSPVHRLPSNQYSSNRSSNSSIEHQRSPVSSRPSTSSGNPFADSTPSFAERPASHSSASTNELPTPSSDQAQKGKAASGNKSKSPYSGHVGHSPSLSPRIVDSDHVYEGVEILREQIDAVTEDPSDSSRPNTASTPAHYVELPDEDTETMQARKWADSFVSRAADVDNGDDTLGKSDKRKSDQSEGQSSTLGKTSKPAEKEAYAPATKAPAPAFSYNPDEDDDDEVMTWAVQMQPTKNVDPPAAAAPPEASKAESSTGVSAASKTRKEPPKHINLPPAGMDLTSSPVASPRSDKPALRVKTDVSSQTSKLAAAEIKSSEGKRSASPRSASRRPRQNSKDTAADDGRRATVPVRTGSAKDASSKSMARRASFNDNAWAYRPSVEQVYDNLEEFFPGHDLDKPIVDAGVSGPNSAMSSPALDPALPSPSLAKVAELNTTQQQKEPDTPVRLSRGHDATDREGTRRFNHNRKSIRMVAQDRKSRLKREEVAAKALSTLGKDETKDKLARRKSTKVWGRKIEEVTSAEADLLYSARDPASADKDRGELAPVKWLKGELIGKGTYGHVYIGFNVTNGEMFAVKQVELPRTGSDKDDNRQTSVVEALKSEMDLLKDLEHEKIVSYLGFEETPRHMSIFLEYVDGGSVGRCLRKHGKFEEQVIQFFTVQILEGLEYLHSRGILHRDLKADNILVRMDGTVKISDFGISKKSNDIYNNNSNMSMQGSIFWMAPEVVHNQKKGYSAKIDIWSLGCVVLEMFAGRRPWDSEEAIQAMFKLGAERLAPPVPQDVVLSNQSSHFLKECFHADPDKRPQASRLLCHKFLTLDKSWDFHMSALYRAMSS